MHNENKSILCYFMEACFSLQLMRKFFRHYLSLLNHCEWQEELVSESLSVWRDMIFSSKEDSAPDGLKCHFVSMYLDELDTAGLGKVSFQSAKLFSTHQTLVCADIK